MSVTFHLMALKQIKLELGTLSLCPVLGILIPDVCCCHTYISFRNLRVVLLEGALMSEAKLLLFIDLVWV